MDTSTTYEAGHADGYRVGAYGVDPDGNWAVPGYSEELFGDDDYRRGLQQGRNARINVAGDDHQALAQQATDAARRYAREQGQS